MNKRIILGSTLAFAMIASSTAMSGGLSRGGVDFSLLYSDKKVDSEVGFTFVAPQRTIDSATRAVNLTGGPNLTTTDIDVTVATLYRKLQLRLVSVNTLTVRRHFQRHLVPIKTTD